MRKPKNPEMIVLELKAYFAAKGITTSAAIARSTNIEQSKIYRNLFGRPKRISATLINLCKYANINLDAEVVAPHPAGNRTLMRALALTWDGTEEHARRISTLLFALKRANM